MKPDPQEPADLLNLLRQQLILAQVRIMELEDVRDELTPRLAECGKLLASAQTVAEQKIEAADHLEKVRAELHGRYVNLQAESDHLRHMQHVTNEALKAARAESAASLGRIGALLSEIENLHLLTRQLAETDHKNLSRIGQLEAERQQAREEAATRLERITQLDAEQRALKASRSWRWTAWLRSLERIRK